MTVACDKDQVMDWKVGEEPRFLADVMLGSLARWLRILGFDTAYERRIEDRDIIRRHLAERRRVLTRDADLVKRRVMGGAFLLESDDLGEQLREVLRRSGQTARRNRLFTRCLECNERLQKITKEEAAGAVPAYVLRTQPAFCRCPGCFKIYWAGTHRRNALIRLQEFGIRLNESNRPV